MGHKFVWVGAGLVAFLLIAILLAPAGQTRTVSPAAPTVQLGIPLLARGPLPDLVVTYAWTTLVGDYCGGSAYSVTEACVANRGAGPAGAFVVRADGVLLGRVAGLPAGKQACVEGLVGTPWTVEADADHQVIEENENNNTTIVPIPTPPPCPTDTLPPP
jgi:hypothetical protein